MAENKIIGGGSLLIAWQLKRKSVLIVGGGEVASQRIDSVLTTDAHIDIIAPASGLHPRSQQLIEQHTARITHIDKEFSFSAISEDISESSPANVELDAYGMVLTALDDSDLSRHIAEECRARRIPVNAADIPDLCDFYFGGQIRDGPLQIMISTNGNAPRLAAIIKNKVKASLSGFEGAALTKVGILRTKLKERAPGVGGEIGKTRMRWMSRVCEKWTLEQLAMMDENMMEVLLTEGWEVAQVPTFEQASGLQKDWAKQIKSKVSPSAPSLASFIAGVAVAALVIAACRTRR